jgi:hypothetical protein
MNPNVRYCETFGFIVIVLLLLLCFRAFRMTTSKSQPVAVNAVRFVILLII